MQNIFPPTVTEHKLTLTDGSRVSLFVDPSETYGHALARTHIRPDEVAVISLDSSPIWYAPDDTVATR